MRNYIYEFSLTENNSGFPKRKITSGGLKWTKLHKTIFLLICEYKIKMRKLQ